jgi:hypothetical protein
MNALVFAQTDSTGQKVTLIVFALVAAAAALALLTAWYWRITDPALRDGEAHGRGGRRNRRKPPPDPSVDPGAASPPQPVQADEIGAAADHTRLMTRSDILDQAQVPDASPDQPRPEVIDLRASSVDPKAARSESADDTTGEIRPSSAPRAARSDQSEEVIDLDRVDAQTRASSEIGPAGAHDQGIDFEEWLALAEDES